MSSYAEPADFLVAAVAAFAVGVSYAAWAWRRGWQARPPRWVAVAAATFLGLGIGSVVQAEWPGGWTAADCAPAGDCAVVTNAPAPLLLMLVLGAAAGSLVLAGHFVPWRREAVWLMLSLPLAATAVVLADLDVRVGPWVAAWAAWLALSPGAVKAAWPAPRGPSPEPPSRG